MRETLCDAIALAKPATVWGKAQAEEQGISSRTESLFAHIPFHSALDDNSSNPSLVRADVHDSPMRSFPVRTAAKFKRRRWNSSAVHMSMSGFPSFLADLSGFVSSDVPPHALRFQKPRVQRHMCLKTAKGIVRKGQRRVSCQKETVLSPLMRVRSNGWSGMSASLLTCVGNSSNDVSSDCVNSARVFHEEAEAQLHGVQLDKTHRGLDPQTQKKKPPRLPIHKAKQQEQPKEDLEGLEAKLEIDMKKGTPSTLYLPSGGDSVFQSVSKPFDVQEVDPNSITEKNTETSASDAKSKEQENKEDDVRTEKETCGGGEPLTEQKSTKTQGRENEEAPILLQPNCLPCRQDIFSTLSANSDSPPVPTSPLSTSCDTFSVPASALPASVLLLRRAKLRTRRTSTTTDAACEEGNEACLCDMAPKEWSSFREALRNCMARKHSVAEVDEDVQSLPLSIPSPHSERSGSSCRAGKGKDTNSPTSHTHRSYTPLTRHCTDYGEFGLQSRMRSVADSESFIHGNSTPDISVSSVTCPPVSILCSTFQAAEVLPGLFLGAYGDACNMEALVANGISLVINLAEECPLTEEMRHNTNNISFIQFSLRDHGDENIAQYFKPVTWLIHTQLHRRNLALMKQMLTHGTDALEPSFSMAKLSSSGCGGVLVHCRMGISRSATIVLAYAMIYGRGMNGKVCPKALHEFAVSPNGSVLSKMAGVLDSTLQEMCQAPDAFQNSNETMPSPSCCCCKTWWDSQRAQGKGSASRPMFVMKYRNAFKMVKSRKGDINPNLGFVLALRQLESGTLTVM